ncbi:hypothetical protein D3C72_2067690 [compost metagenome]
MEPSAALSTARMVSPAQLALACGTLTAAHWRKLLLPMMTAPAARKRAATKESQLACVARGAWVRVFMRSPVAMLSRKTTGMPCKGPRTLCTCRSRSISRAIFKASGLISMPG